MNDLRLCVVLRNKQFVSLRITRVEIEESILYAHSEDTVVGFFDLGYVNAYWISDSKSDNQKGANNAGN